MVEAVNIKDHIDAGHYAPGKNLVRMRNGEVALIYTTDHGGDWPIAGSIADGSFLNGRGLFCWRDDGQITTTGPHAHDLMPPPSRKQQIIAWAIVDREGSILSLRSSPPAGVATGIEQCVELTGEREVPWS